MLEVLKMKSPSCFCLPEGVRFESGLPSHLLKTKQQSFQLTASPLGHEDEVREVGIRGEELIPEHVVKPGVRGASCNIRRQIPIEFLEQTGGRTRAEPVYQTDRVMINRPVVRRKIQIAEP